MSGTDEAGHREFAHSERRHALVDAKVSGESVQRPGPGPVEEGLAVLVSTGHPSITLLACTECGVLLWDVEAHWTDAHAHRLHALRAIAARG